MFARRFENYSRVIKSDSKMTEAFEKTKYYNFSEVLISFFL